jgi:hypothetical protein
MSETKTPDEQLVALKAFARWVIKNSAMECDLDIGAVQDEALKLGIIEERTATEDNFAEWQVVDYVGRGDTFYVFADWVKKVPAKDASDESGEGKAASEGAHEASKP